MPQVRIVAKNFMDMVAALPAMKLDKLYESTFICEAVLRSLPPLAKKYVLQMLFIDSPIAAKSMEDWVLPDGLSKHKVAIDRLLQLRLFVEVTDRKKETSYRLNPIFQSNMQKCLVYGGTLPREPMPTSATGRLPSLEDLDSHALNQWEDFLLQLINSAQVDRPTNFSPSIMRVFQRGLLSPRENEAPRLTENGFQFLLMDTNAQLWYMIREYILSSEDRGVDPTDLISFLLELSFHSMGEAYNLSTLTDVQSNAIKDFSDLGENMRLPAIEKFVFEVCSLWFFLAMVVAGTRGPNGTGPRFPAVICFGDSIVDTGNNNLLPTLAKSDFPPYGNDFIGHQPTGRFSNGKVPSDFIASKLGIKELLPAFLSPILSSEDLLTGVSFASGSSGYDPLTSELVSAITIQDQLELFNDYKQKLQATTDTGRAESIIRESIYVVCSGTNDFANTYFSTPFRRGHYDMPAYASFMVDSAATFVEDLYDSGARKIVVVGLPPIGCLPSERTFGGGSKRGCVSLYNQAAEEFNLKLMRKIKMLQKKLQHSTIIYVDIFMKLLHLIQHPSEYGFEEANKGCCGSGELEVGPFCNIKSVICDDVSKYLFWDSVHPTERAYEILSEELVREALPQFS